MSKKLKIYLIDDDSDIRKITKIVLEKDSYEVHCFSNLTEFDMGLKKSFPDLIIADIKLTKEYIFTFLEERLKDKALLRVPVIIISSISNQKFVTKALSYSISDYLLKPINNTYLKASVSSVLKSKASLVADLSQRKEIVIQVPIEFTEISEDRILASSKVRLLSGKEYCIHSSELTEEGLSTKKLKTIKSSSLLSNAKSFALSFRLRGVRESLLKKIRSGKF